MGLLEALFGEEAEILQERDFQLLLLAGFTGPLGLSLLSPLLDTLTGPYGVSETEIGLLMSAFTAPAIVLTPVMGVISDRYGRKPVMTAGLLLFGFAGVALSLTTDFHAALLLRLLQGVGGAAILPIIITSLGDLYSGDREATAQGFRFTTSGLTQTVFPAIAGFLVVVAWQYPLLLYGLAVPIGLVVHVGLDEPTDHVNANDRDVHPDGGSGANEGIGGDGTSSPNGSHVRRMVRLMSRRDVASMLVAYGLPASVYVGFLTYVSIIVVRILGGTPAETGLLVALTNLMKAGSASQVGRILSFFESRVPLLVGANALMGVGIAVVALTSSLAVAGAGVVVMGLALGVIQSLYRSIMTGLPPETLRGGLVSVAESIIRLGVTVTPIILGIVIGALASTLGFATAIRWTILGLGIAGSIVSLVAAVTAVTTTDAIA